MSIEDFRIGYITCALWSSTDEHCEPLDANFTVDDFAPSALAELDVDLVAFYEEHHESWANLPGYSDERSGHDFWLTRNHHGAGYWDRGFGHVGEALTDACRPYGSVDLYRGDDGLVYVS